MSIEKIREQFEDWYARSWADDDCRFDTAFLTDTYDQYLNTSVHESWVAWQASRAVLVIELPIERNVPRVSVPFMFADEVHGAIEAAGVKCK